MSAGESTTFTTDPCRWRFAGREADVALTVRPSRRRIFPLGRRLRPDRERVRHAGRAAGRPVRAAGGQAPRAALAARDKALGPWWPPRRAAARGGRGGRGRGAASSQLDQLERVGASIEVYLAEREQDRGGVRRRATAATEGASRSSCCSTRWPTPRSSQVTDDELTTRSFTAPSGPAWPRRQYSDQLVRAGIAGSVSATSAAARRCAVLERVDDHVTPTASPRVSTEELTAGDQDEDHTGQTTTDREWRPGA